MVQGRRKVNERDIWSVKVGSPVIVHLEHSGLQLASSSKLSRPVGFVDVVANGSTRDTRVWAEVANPNNVLRPGLFGDDEDSACRPESPHSRLR